MLDMFKRKTDLPEYNSYYAGSGLMLMASVYAAHVAHIPHIYTMGYLAASICAIGAIVGLAN